MYLRKQMSANALINGLLPKSDFVVFRDNIVA
jgi:hypothetical protein